MKFTEEQYRKIVEAWDSKNTYRQATTAVIETINSFSITFTDLNGDEALALANPATRDWAHEQFVEKKYVWYSKLSTEIHGVTKYKRLYRSTDSGEVSDVLRTKDARRYPMNNLTESEIREWGYDPERFNKEEVE